MVKTLVATPDPEECPWCLEKERHEPINVTVRHGSTHCTRMRWCFVCGQGDGEVVDCEGCPNPSA